MSKRKHSFKEESRKKRKLEEVIKNQNISCEGYFILKYLYDKDDLDYIHVHVLPLKLKEIFVILCDKCKHYQIIDGFFTDDIWPIKQSFELITKDDDFSFLYEFNMKKNNDVENLLKESLSKIDSFDHQMFHQKLCEICKK